MTLAPINSLAFSSTRTELAGLLHGPGLLIQRSLLVVDGPSTGHAKADNATTSQPITIHLAFPFMMHLQKCQQEMLTVTAADTPFAAFLTCCILTIPTSLVGILGDSKRRDSHRHFA